MKTPFATFIVAAALSMTVHAQSLEECQKAAELNYPMIRQYDLIEKTQRLAVANIQKGWLPKVSASAQATLQSDVTAWPDDMKSMLTGMGIDVKGLRKDQYRVGVDIQQDLYDGGNKSLQKQMARAEAGVESAKNEVTLYAVRKSVNDLYFRLLLTDEQIILSQDMQELLSHTEKKLASLLKNGAAALCDYQSVKADLLDATQRLTALKDQRATIARMLSTLCGIEVTHAERTGLSAELPTTSAIRPELRAFEAQKQLLQLREKSVDNAQKPHVGLFAQGFYGYPGYNMFEDMMQHRWTLNGMVGARMTWNIGSLYTRKNDKAQLALRRESLNVQRETFLFNNRLEQIQHEAEIDRYRKMKANDEEIVSLRGSIRKAAESRLDHGIIDVNDLLKVIKNENAARVQMATHEIEMLKAVYELRHTANLYPERHK